MEFRVPGKIVKFSFLPMLGTEVLHAEVHPAKECQKGYTVIIKMQGIASAFKGRLLKDTSEGPIEKHTADMRLYCKGVFISDQQYSSVWDWNLNNVSINRDRSMVDQFDLCYEGAKWLSYHGTDDHFDLILKKLDSIEAVSMTQWLNDKGSAKLADAFVRIYGERACLSDANLRSMSLAEQLGFTVVDVPDHMQSKLYGRIKTATQVLPKNSELEPVDIEPYREAVARLRQLDSLICAPHFKVMIFSNRMENLKGKADLDDLTMWLSEGLFTDGNELELVRTYLHEAGHLMSNAPDATTSFEMALDGIAGRLAMKILGESN